MFISFNEVLIFFHIKPSVAEDHYNTCMSTNSAMYLYMCNLLGCFLQYLFLAENSYMITDTICYRQARHIQCKFV